MLKKSSIIIFGFLLLGFGGGFAVLNQLQPIGNSSRMTVLDIAEGASLSDVAGTTSSAEFDQERLGRLSG